MNGSLVNCLSYHFLTEATECLIIQRGKKETLGHITMNGEKGELEISVESSPEFQTLTSTVPRHLHLDAYYTSHPCK